MLIAWFIITGIIALLMLLGLIGRWDEPSSWVGALALSSVILTALIIFRALGVV